MIKIYNNFINNYLLKKEINNYLLNFFEKYKQNYFLKFKHKNVSKSYTYEKLILIINYSTKTVLIKDYISDINFERLEFNNFISYFNNYVENYYDNIDILTIDEENINKILILDKNKFSKFIHKYISLNYFNFKFLDNRIIDNLNSETIKKYNILVKANNFDLI